ncbi:unnamed protein product [Brachionus calyciflorus]|uniref:Protein NO VEIN C-terminal domain-containing protein n=1 Tax=Brachionus calyciflorus TaxID=104777 RepID=A0A813UNC3_9BILA|nr:unnamed protein product [Brachionus calyciflorus]
MPLIVISGNYYNHIYRIIYSRSKIPSLNYDFQFLDVDLQNSVLYNYNRNKERIIFMLIDQPDDVKKLKLDDITKLIFISNDKEILRSHYELGNNKKDFENDAWKKYQDLEREINKIDIGNKMSTLRSDNLFDLTNQIKVETGLDLIINNPYDLFSHDRTFYLAQKKSEWYFKLKQNKYDKSLLEDIMNHFYYYWLLSSKEKGKFFSDFYNSDFCSFLIKACTLHLIDKEEDMNLLFQIVISLNLAIEDEKYVKRANSSFIKNKDFLALIEALLDSSDLKLNFLAFRCISNALHSETDILNVFNKQDEILKLVFISINKVYLNLFKDTNDDDLLFFSEYVKYIRCIEVLDKSFKVSSAIDCSKSLDRLVLIINLVFEVLKSNNLERDLHFLKKESSIEKVYDLLMTSDCEPDEFLEKINTDNDRLELILKQRDELYELRNELKVAEKQNAQMKREMSILKQKLLEKEKILIEKTIKLDDLKHKLNIDKSKVLVEIEPKNSIEMKKFNKFSIDELNPNVNEFLKNLRQELSIFSTIGRIGHLDNLSEKLYSSPVHFLNEIIQNADDCEFETSIKKLKIILKENHITFCINEKGFNSSGVKALSSFGKSNKVKGKHTGCKGIGFKSVFSCTDNPVVYSNPWNFYFKKEVGNDLSYIEPHHLTNEKLENEYQDLDDIIKKEHEFKTFIHLPFKESFKSKNEIKIDPNILLFTRNLNSIIFEKNDEITTLEIKVQSVDSPDYKIEKKILNDNQKFITCSKNNFSLAFPLDEIQSENRLYGVLPIENVYLEFNFLLNADWDLISNRQDLDLTENNFNLRESLAQAFFWSLENISDLKVKKLYYTPNNTNNCFWQQFVQEIKDKLKYNGSFLLKKLPDDLKPLISDISIFEKIGIQITDKDIFEEVSYKDILNLIDFIQLKDKTWWKFLFIYLNRLEKNLEKSYLKNYSIFKIGNTRRALDERKMYFLESKQTSFWREEFEFVEYESEFEKLFLEKLLPVYTYERVATFLNLIHEDLIDAQYLNEIEKICYDLKFIKDCGSYDKLNLEYLVIPVKGSQKFVERVNKTIQTRILNYDFYKKNMLKYNKQSNYVDIELIYKVLNIENILEKLEWELFLNQIGCQYPCVENTFIDRNSIEYLFDIKDEMLVNTICNKSSVARDLINLLNKPKNEKFYHNNGEYCRNFEKKIHNFREMNKIGLNAEIYFSNWLKNEFGSEYNIVNNWRSSYSENQNCDDSLGYNFIIKDTLNKFGFGYNVECLIDVKGFKGKSEQRFVMSQNQFEIRNKLIGSKEKIYLIVIIEDIETENPRICKWLKTTDQIRSTEFTKIFYEIEYD